MLTPDPALVRCTYLGEDEGYTARSNIGCDAVTGRCLPSGGAGHRDGLGSDSWARIGLGTGLVPPRQRSLPVLAGLTRRFVHWQTCPHRRDGPSPQALTRCSGSDHVYRLTSKHISLIGSSGAIPAFSRQIRICSSTVSTPSRSGSSKPLRCQPRVASTITP